MFREVRICEKCGRIWTTSKNYLELRYKNKCRFCGGNIVKKWITDDEYKEAVKKKLIIRRH